MPPPVLAGRASCLNSLHRLGFVVRRPKKRLLKADAAKRAAFVREYAILRVVAQLTGAKTFFADEAHFSAAADLRGTWVLKGGPALVDSTSTRWGEKASYSSAVSPARSVAVMSLVASSLTPVRTSTDGGLPDDHQVPGRHRSWARRPLTPGCAGPPLPAW